MEEVGDTEAAPLLTLTAAAKRLGVHPATLRRWADSGDVLVMVTPGGHRRFPVAEIERLAQSRHAGKQSDDVASLVIDAAIGRARSGIAHTPDHTWLASFTDDQRSYMRDLGQRVMSLLQRFVAEDQGDEALIREAEIIGREYAERTAGQGMELPVVLQAITFFRDAIVMAAVTTPEVERMERDRRGQLMRRINTFLATILIAVAQAFGE